MAILTLRGGNYLKLPVAIQGVLRSFLGVRLVIEAELEVNVFIIDQTELDRLERGEEVPMLFRRERIRNLNESVNIAPRSGVAVIIIQNTTLEPTALRYEVS